MARENETRYRVVAQGETFTHWKLLAWLQTDWFWARWWLRWRGRLPYTRRLLIWISPRVLHVTKRSTAQLQGETRASFGTYFPSCHLCPIWKPSVTVWMSVNRCGSLSVLSHPESLVPISKLPQTDINKTVMIFTVFNRGSCMFSGWMFSLQKIKAFPGRLLMSWRIFGSRLLEHLVSLCVSSWHKIQRGGLAVKYCAVSFLPRLSQERL